MFFRAFAILSSLSSQLFLIILFLALAFGWGTIKKEGPFSDFERHKYILNFVVTMHIIIAMLIYHDHEEYHMFHDYQGFHGLALCYARLVIFVIFSIGLVRTWMKLSEDQIAERVDPGSQTRFLAVTGSIGSFYILALPASVYWANTSMPAFS